MVARRRAPPPAQSSGLERLGQRATPGRPAARSEAHHEHGRRRRRPSRKTKTKSPAARAASPLGCQPMDKEKPARLNSRANTRRRALPRIREPGRRSARPGSSAAVVNSAASTKKFPAPSGSANAADKTKMKCRSASAADIKQEYRSTRARVRALWLEKVGNASHAANREPGRRSARPGSSVMAAVASSAASTKKSRRRAARPTRLTKQK